MDTERTVADWAKQARADGVKRFPKLTRSRVLAAAENDEGAGICVYCGADGEDYCEPDARNYHCETCGHAAVFGAEEIIMQVAL